MANKAKKIPHIKPINNFAMLFVLSIFQLITGFEAASVRQIGKIFIDFKHVSNPLFL